MLFAGLRFAAALPVRAFTRSMSIEAEIKRKLTDLLHPVELNVINDSSKHAGHSAMRGNTSGESERTLVKKQADFTAHFTVECISEDFKDKKLIQRHRMIYSALGEELKAGLHALVLRTKTPEEAGMTPEEVEEAKKA